MATPQLNLLIAERIAEAKRRIEEAQREVETAREGVTAAKAVVDRAGADQAAKARADEAHRAARERLAAAEERLTFEQAQLNRLLQREPSGALPGWVQYAVFGLMALIVLVFLMYGIVSDTLLPSLTSIATARGLITFLITVVTVTIALVLVLATVVSDSPDRAKRFLDGKDLLTALIGVLGTIVGFYFGQSLDGVEGPNIAPVYLSSSTAKQGEKVTLVTFVSGGKAPYTYDIVFRPAVLPAVEPRQSPDGQIRAEVMVPEVMADTEVSFVIRVKDGEGKVVVYDSLDHDQKIALKKE